MDRRFRPRRFISHIAKLRLVTPRVNSSSVILTESDSLIGNWKLVSWQVIVENGVPQNVFGSNPKGYLILTREGRSMALTTADNRRGGMGNAERAELHKSMLAYSGKYRI